MKRSVLLATVLISTVQQNVHVSGTNHMVIVGGGNVRVGSLPPHPPSDPPARKSRRKRRWGVPAGLLTFGTTAVLLISVPHPPIVWPAGKSALCKDGSYSRSQTRSGTCSHHEGVRYWRYSADDAYWRQQGAERLETISGTF